MILLDTNVISEMMRPRPDPAVAAWIQPLPRREFWTSTVVVAELLSEDFHGQILSFDLAAAHCYGQILSERQRMGRPIKELDAQIAATARAHGAALATRNIKDFLACNLVLFNPWSDKPKR